MVRGESSTSLTLEMHSTALCLLEWQKFLFKQLVEWIKELIQGDKSSNRILSTGYR